MEKHQVGTSMLSLTAPGPCLLEGEEAAKLARRANEYCAAMRDQQPRKYGVLASVPSLLDKELALAEISHAFDELKADGVTLFTRYGSGHHYLGHPDFREIWDELDRRKAVVFIHPTNPADATSFRPSLPQPIVEFPFETTKTAIDLILSGVMRSHPNCKVILSHGGGTLPYLVERPATVLPDLIDTLTAEQFIEDAKKFYYDTAITGKDMLPLLQKFAHPGHILYGSDYCYASPSVLQYYTGVLDAYEFQASSEEDINRRNALRLFPRLDTSK